MRDEFFIVEHPRLGVLQNLGETEAGWPGHFSFVGSRSGAMRFYSVRSAYDALDLVESNPRRQGCQVRSSRYDLRNFRTAWPVVLRDGTRVIR